MINYELHNNGWTVILKDFDFKNATQEDINQISKLIASNTLVVAKNQQLTIQDEIRIARMFKEPQLFTQDFISEMTGSEIPESEGLFLRVTGEKNEHGLTGIAAHTSEMIWHCNEPGAEYRKPIVWLYGVRGTSGSCTTWNNNILSYQDLDRSVKDQIENYHLQVLLEAGFDAENPDEDEDLVVSDYYPVMVRKNIAGQKGLFFPFLQIIKIKELPDDQSKEMIAWLSLHTIQDKYCYHHNWNDGDVVMSEQNLGIHKRHRFENIEQRLLHRGAFDFPDQDYTN
jgi:alpha-ketoglutarate-dependent taurine dioxygenase